MQLLRLVFLLLLCLSSSSSAATAAAAGTAWRPTGRAPPNHPVTVTVAVKYAAGAGAVLSRELLVRSDPVSHPQSYAHWLSPPHIDSIAAPLPRSVDAVVAWLQTADAVISHTTNSAFLRATMPARAYERLVGGHPLTQYTHTSGATVFRLPEHFRLPADIAQHVDILSPPSARSFPNLRSATFTAVSTTADAADDPNPIPTPPVKITPTVLATRYNTTGERGTGAASNNTQGITNFLRQYVQPSDLDKFFTMFVDEDPKATPPTPSKIVGANNPSDPGTEAMLDAEYLVR